ncbi:c-type cytochrome [Mesorhizobium onobrychidis]|uniref:Cytochrome c n=1 Tax=Mesorhizobium onobrychidis TaxID=2775404 RepID=A0ABY5QPY6_9HYPH|nr:cytochrome c [Mesorhizobium onobrychidis]UVC13221.1 cytochrome c [Mesorhizobium onobrychidis]
MLALAALVAVCVVLVFGGKSGGILKPDDARVIARGEAVYVAHCASCHGRNLEGQPEWKAQDKDGFLPAPPHDESGHTWHHPDTLLFRITKLGVAEAANLKDYKTRMPAFGGILTDAEIIAALSYIKSRWPDDLRRRHDELNRVFAWRESSAR